jgi:hypothetical protein
MTPTTIKAIIVRVAWTFSQSFIGVFLAGLAVNINGVQLKALVIAACAAGLSALKNIYVKPTEIK